MDVSTLEHLRESNATWSLLRKQAAPYIIAFLYGAFKKEARTEIASDQLAVELQAFQEHLQNNEIEALKGSPESILSAWASDSEQILWRSHDAETEKFVFTLRATTEDAIRFVEEMTESKQPVGAESSLKRIFAILEEVVLMGQGNVETHLARLEDKKAALEREIERVRESGFLDNSTYRVREEFRHLLNEIRNLSGDFRKVEESFRQIAKDIQKASLGDELSRGDILEYILESDEQIRGSEQGQSFFGFLSLLNSPEQMEKLDSLRHELREINSLSDYSSELSEVMRFERRLLAESERVSKTVQRLSRQLRRALDDRANAERQRVLGQIQTIMAAFSREDFYPGDHDNLIAIEEITPIRSIDDFAPYQPQAKLQKETAATFEADEAEKQAAINAYNALQRLDTEALVQGIQSSFRHRKQDALSLNELIADHPPKHGLVEVAAYLQIAHDWNCPIDRHNKQRIELDIRNAQDEIQRVGVETPRVEFTRDAMNAHVSIK